MRENEDADASSPQLSPGWAFPFFFFSFSYSPAFPLVQAIMEMLCVSQCANPRISNLQSPLISAPGFSPPIPQGASSYLDSYLRDPLLFADICTHAVQRVMTSPWDAT